jgi:hypothetical protein
VLCLDEKTSMQPRTRTTATPPALPDNIRVRVEHGGADIPGLRRLVPGLLTFEDWLARGAAAQIRARFARERVGRLRRGLRQRAAHD